MKRYDNGRYYPRGQSMIIGSNFQSNDGFNWSSFWSHKALFQSDGITANGGTELVNNVGTNAQLLNNLVTNPGMEFDFDPFEPDNIAPVTNERSAVQAHSGTYSRHIILNDAGQTGVRTKYYATKTGETINWSFWVYKVSGAAFFKYVVKKGDGTNAASGNSTEFTGAWRETSGSYVETAGGKLACIILYVSAGAGAKEVYVDDIQASTNDGNVACILPFSAEGGILDTSRLFYDASGYGMTFRLKAHQDPNGYNRSIFNFPGNKLIVLKEQPAYYYYCHIIEYLDYGTLFFDNLENIVTVKADGSGDYLTIADAVAGIVALGTSNYLNRFRIDLYDNITLTQTAHYTVVFGAYHWYYDLKDDQYLFGVGGGKSISGSLPDTATDNETTFYEVAAYNARCGVKNISFSMKNGRYACHIDETAGANKMQMFFNCTFRHYGNQEVVDYRIDHALPYVGVNPGTNAVGTGCRTGQEMYFSRCKMYGIHPVAWHTNVNFTNIAKLTLFMCDLVSEAIYSTLYNPLSIISYSALFNSLMSRIVNAVNIYKGTNNGGIRYTAEYYETVATNLYILNDMTISEYKNTTIFENVATAGGSLRITSADPLGSVTNVAGTGATAIMPTSDYSDNHATGRLEVGEWSYNPNVKLGVRLGDCSGVNKILTCDVDGSGKTITFNENFTAKTNAYVLAFIDTALGGSATSSLYQRASENTLNVLG